MGQDNWVPEAFTCPVSLDRPGRLDFEARWLLRPLSLESLTLLGGVSDSLVVFPPLFFETLAGSDVILPHYRCATTHFPSGPQKKPTTTHTPGTEPLEPRSLRQTSDTPEKRTVEKPWLAWWTLTSLPFAVSRNFASRWKLVELS